MVAWEGDAARSGRVGSSERGLTDCTWVWEGRRHRSTRPAQSTKRGCGGVAVVVL